MGLPPTERLPQEPEANGDGDLHVEAVAQEKHVREGSRLPLSQL